MKELMLITVKNSFEGEHYYANAPDEVAFLRNPHRHIFYVESEIEVFHEDRELEFIMVKREIDRFLKTQDNLNHRSCEMIAKEIKSFLKLRYPLPESADYYRFGEDCKRDRIVNIRVSEDGENGVYLREV